MAHHSMFEPDPEKVDSSAARSGVESDQAAPPKVLRESDLAELTARFTVHGGGKVSAELSADLALEVVLNEIVEQACLATRASGAAIVVERKGEWVCRASAGENAPQLGARLDAEKGLSGACVQTRTVQICDDAENDTRVDTDACRELGIQSVIILPLLLGDRLVGVFEVFSSWPSAFSERDQRTLEALSQRVLKNLQTAANPAPAAAPAKLPVATYTTMADLIVSDLEAASAGKIVEPKPASESGTELESAAPDAVREQAPIFDAPTSPAATLFSNAQNETESDRGIDLLTRILSVAVLTLAVVLVAVTGMRLTGRRIKTRARVQATVAAASSSASSAENQSVNSGSSALPIPPQNLPADALRSKGSPVPAGGLMVYENGKEVFRMQPAADVERVSGTGTKRGAEPGGADGIVQRIEPQYPEEARLNGIEGAVVVDVNIDRDGKVVEVKTVSGAPVLAQAVSDAVKQWVFRPHRVGGQLVPMETRITLNFRLPH